MSTRQFNQQFHCSNCGCMSSAETSFGRWIRENKHLDSTKGIVVYDIDYIVHRCKTAHGKHKQLMMFVEVKTRNSDMTDSQRDTLYMAAQLTQNRRMNPALKNKRNRWNSAIVKGWSRGVTEVWSEFEKGFVDVLHFGFFKLQFSGLGPTDSEFILWNEKPIDAETLTKLLSFDIDPVRFEDIAELFRNHHAPKRFALFESNGIVIPPKFEMFDMKDGKRS